MSRAASRGASRHASRAASRAASRTASCSASRATLRVASRAASRAALRAASRAASRHASRAASLCAGRPVGVPFDLPRVPHGSSVCVAPQFVHRKHLTVSIGPTSSSRQGHALNLVQFDVNQHFCTERRSQQKIPVSQETKAWLCPYSGSAQGWFSSKLWLLQRWKRQSSRHCRRQCLPL